MIGLGPAGRLGVSRRPDGSWEALCWAPRSRSVAVVFVDRSDRVELDAADGGYFAGSLGSRDPGARYWLELDDGRRLADPASMSQPDGVAGPSALFDPAAYRWSDEEFSAPGPRELVLYELHIGTFRAPSDPSAPGGRRPGTFSTAADALADLAALGVTAVEPMPIASFPGERNWGYDGVFPFAAQASYGGPKGFMAFVDAAHSAGLAVILDVVYNHFGPEGSVHEQFGPYSSGRYSTPWGDALNFDGPGSDEVRRYFMENALGWFADFHVDGLRLDAIHGIIDTSARPFLAELSECTASLADSLDRPLLLIAESEDNNPRVIASTESGGYGMDAQWADDFHHGLHVALTGERRGYYLDYRGTPDLAKAIESGFSYTGQYSRSRARRHGRRPMHATPTRFTVAAQNHDQVGNRPGSERLASLVSSAALRVAAAVVCCAPQMPLLFMGEEDGEMAPFGYFVDHADADLIEAVRRGRAAEMGEEGSLDPAAAATFAASCLNPVGVDATGEGAIGVDGPERLQMRLGLRRLYADLLSFRRSTPIVTDPVAHTHAEAGDTTLVVLRRSHSAGMWFAANTGEQSAVIAVPTGVWHLAVDTADPAYGGPGSHAQAAVAGPGGLTLPPSSFVCYLEESPHA